MMDGMTYEERAQIAENRLQKAENRLQKLEEQIKRLIVWGDRLAGASYTTDPNAEHWSYEVSLAKELIK